MGAPSGPLIRPTAPTAAAPARPRTSSASQLVATPSRQLAHAAAAGSLRLRSPAIAPQCGRPQVPAPPHLRVAAAACSPAAREPPCPHEATVACSSGRPRATMPPRGHRGLLAGRLSTRPPLLLAGCHRPVARFHSSSDGFNSGRAQIDRQGCCDAVGARNWIGLA